MQWHSIAKSRGAVLRGRYLVPEERPRFRDGEQVGDVLRGFARRDVDVPVSSNTTVCGRTACHSRTCTAGGRDRGRVERVAVLEREP